jgi:membrane-bound serine protease (ClpP class)
VITFTNAEALRYGYCEAEVGSLDEILKRTGMTGATLTNYEPSGTDKAIGFLRSPFLSGILILLILGGIYFEFQHPGAFFPIGVSMIAALLYFAPNYLEGLAANWEILLFFTGLILLILEIFVIPGFGVTGISGIILIISALILALLKNNFLNFDTVGAHALNRALGIVSLSFVTFIILAIILSHYMVHSNFFERIAHTATLADSKAYSGMPAHAGVIDQPGICITDLKPQGKVEVNGVVYNAASNGGYIDAGTKVVVIRETELMIWVKRTV